MIHVKPDPDALLASAIAILKSPDNTFHLGAAMPKALADSKLAAFKDAAKRAAAKGITRPKHVPNSVFDIVPQGVDETPDDVVHSDCLSNNDHQESNMSETTESTKTKQEIAAEKAAAKMAAKEAKLKAAAEAKAAREAAKAQAAAEKAAAKEAARLLKEAEKAAKAQAAEEGEAKGAVMLALRRKVAEGIYVKGKNGQLRSNDPVALALESLPAAKVVPLLIGFLGLDGNPYAALNYGQQSMNLRNRLRGALRKGVVNEADFLALVAANTPAPVDQAAEAVEA